MTEIRYWPRIGMRVERKAAEQFIDKLITNTMEAGSRLDDDIEELVPCPDCGAYIAKGSNQRCNELSCPFIN